MRAWRGGCAPLPASCSPGCLHPGSSSEVPTHPPASRSNILHEWYDVAMATSWRYPYERIPSRHFTAVGSAGGSRKVDLVVIHDMEAPELEKTAENVARYFQTTDRLVSSHYCIDADSIVQCVREDDVAWCAPGTNHNGIQLEHAGYASQTRSQWDDVYSREMLRLSAQLTAQLCAEYNIPVSYVREDALRAGVRGITTHWQASLAFKRSTHTDPGPNFPMDSYLSLVSTYLAELLEPARPWPIPVPRWFWAWAEWRLGGNVGPRPAGAQEVIRKEGRIPDWAWRRLEALIAGRKGK